MRDRVFNRWPNCIGHIFWRFFWWNKDFTNIWIYKAQTYLNLALLLYNLITNWESSLKLIDVLTKCQRKFYWNSPKSHRYKNNFVFYYDFFNPFVRFSVMNALVCVVSILLSRSVLVIFVNIVIKRQVWYAIKQGSIHYVSTIMSWTKSGI